ncbi:MAG: hypothetical protein ACOY5V_12645, partial [Pseudomonadota bacterium]
MSRRSRELVSASDARASHRPPAHRVRQSRAASGVNRVCAPPRALPPMLLFASTILLSAFLLFLVQPIIAKQILPW